MSQQPPYPPTSAPASNGDADIPHQPITEPQGEHPAIPDAQAEFFRRANEALRAQWEETRAAFLTQLNAQHHEWSAQHQPSTPVANPQNGPAPAHNGPHVPAYPHGAYGYHPPPPPPPRMRFILPVRAYTPVLGKPHTYPPLLSLALDQCAKDALKYQPTRPNGEGPTYHVVRSISSHYANTETHILATYKSVQKANNEVLKYFIDNYWNENMEEPMFEAMDGGRLRCEVPMAGYMGRRESVYVSDSFTGAA